MEIVKAEIGHADIVGWVHSEAWKQAYRGVFPDKYLNEDTPEKRTQEFWDSCKNKGVCYYMICEEDQAVGIIKLIDEEEVCEISSFYILDEHRNRGFGKQVVEYLRKEFNKKKLVLWVLEENVKARRFYEYNDFKSTGNTRVIQRGNQYVQLQYEL